MAEIFNFPGTDPTASAPENAPVDNDTLIAYQDALIARWCAVGEELKRRGALRMLDFDLQLEISELVREVAQWEP